MALWAVAGSADAITVSGWPIPDLSGATPPAALGDDPILGRQACPPLTRLNLKERKAEDLLTRRIVEEFRDERRGSLWRLELRPGLFWWSGEPVVAQDVAVFVAKRLPEVVKRKGGDHWELPAFEATADGDRFVTVSWKKPPPFGPYVLNGEPLFRPAPGSTSYECAGLYKITHATATAVELKPAPGYQAKKPLPAVRLLATGADADLAFHYASSQSNRVCTAPFELPIATVIGWNGRRGLTADPRVRGILTQLLPRGALLREGASALGELATAPIPTMHPGYDATVPLRSFDLQAASDALNGLGFRRKSPDTPRLDAAGQPLRLVLRTSSSTASLAGKVVADALASVGVGVVFAKPGEPGLVDGELMSVALDWPGGDLLQDFHSRAADGGTLWALHDKALDQRLESYALSLTTATPAFATLAQIHKTLAAQEPVSVIMQHRACAVARGLPAWPKAGPDELDPDWFRRLLL